MWVRVFDWMLADNEPPTPDTGSLLRSIGVRVQGAVTPADAATPDGVAALSQRNLAGTPWSAYALTGIAGQGRNIRAGDGPSDEANGHAGAEFVLTVSADRLQVHFDGHASDVLADSRVTVTGGLELVGDYEWDAFDLSDSRADWIVTKTAVMTDGDLAVDLEHPPGV